MAMIIEVNMKTIGKYKNGNYITIIYDDGTKKRIAPHDTFIPDFAESMDWTISTKCENKCKFCYLGCSSEGEQCDFEKYSKLLESLHPYTEIAINLNNPIHQDLVPFLFKMAEKHVIVNATINQSDFEKNYDRLKKLTDSHLIWGLGVSLNNVTEEFVNKIKYFDNAVLHCINGIFSAEDYEILKDNDLKLLILGYKQIGRGSDYYFQDIQNIKFKQSWLYEYLPNIIQKFKVVSFDNNALEQLHVKRLMNDKDWETFYQGDEGTISFFINLVEGYFARDSMSPNHYPIKQGMTIDDMFKIIRRAI